MVSLCFYFQVHQPYRIKRYRIFDVGVNGEYFSDNSEKNLNNKKVLLKVSEKCYLPANKLMLEMIKENPDFKISYSISGIALEQFEEYCPEVLKSFQELVDTGNVEMLDETYYHSLSALYSKEEFIRQVKLHTQKIKKLFNKKPCVFRNTELIYNNELAEWVSSLGYKGILSEGTEKILGWRSPTYVYKPINTDISLLLKNYRLSDDIAFRFSEKSWSEWPLTTEKFGSWINSINGNGYLANLFMDYETFGEHQWKETGIFDFMKALPKEIKKRSDNNFITPSEAIKKYKPVADLNVPYYISWADIDRDLSAWVSNKMQQSALQELYSLEKDVLSTENNKIIDYWRKLQTSDHFYYMCTKWFADGDVHKYFNPYDSPYDAFITFMNVLKDLRFRINEIKANQLCYIPREVTKNETKQD